MKKAIVIAVFAAMLFVAPAVSLWAEPPAIDTEEELNNFVKEVNPVLASRLDKLRAVNMVEYRKVLQEIAQKFHEFKQLEQTRPDLARKALDLLKQEGQVGELAQQYRESNDAQAKEKLRGEMRNLLAQAIENKIVLQESHAVAIENDLNRLKARIAQKKEFKAKIIEKKLSELTADEYLQWE